MTMIASSAQATEQPRIHCFLADDIQATADKKITLVGLHPENVLIVNVPPGTAAPSAGTPHAIESVAILVSISRATGRHPVSIELDGASASIKLPKDQVIQFMPGRTMNMILIFAPLTFASYGKKALTITVGESSSRFEFEVLAGS